MQIEAYGPKSFAVYGYTTPYEDTLRSFRGRPNPNLGGRPGWIFSNKEFPRVEAFVAQANTGRVDTSANYVTIPAPPSSPSIIVPRPSFSPRTTGPLVTIPSASSPRFSSTSSPRFPSAATTRSPRSSSKAASLAAASVPAEAKFPSIPLQIFQYEDKIAVLGDTEPFRESLKAIGGRYNSNIMGNKGWIFVMGKYEQVNSLITRINAGEVPGLAPKYAKTPTSPMQLFQYGPDVAVLGDTKPFRKQLKALGGTFSYDIGGHPGWIFNLTHYPAVNELVTEANAKYF